MNKKALKIFRCLLENGEIVPKIITLEELCVHCTVQLEDTASIAFLEIIEELHPGTVRNVRDHWGRNLLWYSTGKTVYKRLKINPFWFIDSKQDFLSSADPVSPFLLKLGCEPGNTNQLGFSWQYLAQNQALICEDHLNRLRGKCDTSWDKLKKFGSTMLTSAKMFLQRFFNR